MSASQTTTNYHLPVFEPTDVPAWLTDWNSAMGDIDTAIAGAKTAADTAQLTASGAANGVSTLNTTVGNLQTTVGNQGSTITSLGNSLNTVQSLIGNGTPTTTDQTIIGAINEINAAYKVAANIAFDNTGTGMTATNVQAAIVEAYGHGGGGGGSTAAAVSYDNTDSGLTATNVQAAIDEVVTLSNVRWNSTTDRFEVLKNGSWTQSIRAFVNSLAVWVNGVFNLSHKTDVQPSNTPGFHLASEYSVSGNNIVITPIDTNDYGAGIIFEAVDFTDYSDVTIKTNIPNYETLHLDVSGATGTGYLYFCNAQSTNTGKIIICGISTINTDGYSADSYKKASTTRLANQVSAFTNSYITEITIE